MSVDMSNEEYHDMRSESLMIQYTRQVLKRTELLKQYINQSPSVRARVRALRKIQLKTTELDVEFHQRVCQLEREYEERHRDIFLKRRDIVNGTYIPTPEECTFPDPELTLEYAREMEILNINDDVPPESDSVVGVPDFWLTIFKYFPLLEPFVRENDEPALKHLIDVRACSKTEPHLSFVLEFHFSPNEYFSDSVLTKEYYLKCAPDADDPLSFDGPEIFKCVGCPINWYEGKDLTIRAIKKKPTGNLDRSDGRFLVVKSFFNFFSPPDMPTDDTDENFDIINDHLEKDFEIGHYLKERIIPRAILYFTGESEEYSPNDSVSDNSLCEGCAVSEAEGDAEDAETDIETTSI